MTASDLVAAADLVWSLYDTSTSIEEAFTTDASQSHASQAVVTSVTHPHLLGFTPKPAASNQPSKAVLVLGGGGYTQLMAGREGLQVAHWLCALNLTPFILIHRFPNITSPPQAPLDDARRALRLIKDRGFAVNGVGVLGLSSGGHLAASLLAEYPSAWTRSDADDMLPTLEFATIGYAPISTNATGRTIIASKPPLEPPEKQALYDALQPDVALRIPAPPTFVVYAGNDAVVPVANCWRIAEALGQAGAMIEVHVFADAPHGFALDTKDLPVSGWTGLWEKWARQVGVLGVGS